MFSLQEIFHIVTVCCIAAFGLGIGIEDVGAVTFKVIDYGAVGNGVTNDTQVNLQSFLIKNIKWNNNILEKLYTKNPKV